MQERFPFCNKLHNSQECKFVFELSLAISCECDYLYSGPRPMVLVDQHTLHFNSLKYPTLDNVLVRHRYRRMGIEINNWHERAVFQSVGVRAADWQRR